jgi:hypothetical protein
VARKRGFFMGAVDNEIVALRLARNRFIESRWRWP